MAYILEMENFIQNGELSELSNLMEKFKKEIYEFDTEKPNYICNLAAYYGQKEVLEWLKESHFSFDKEKCIEQARIAVYAGKHLKWFGGDYEKQKRLLQDLGGEESTDVPDNLFLPNM